MTDSFNTLGLSDSLQRGLDALGYETPSPIQAQSIPVLLKGRDIIGQAQTGTGKTAAFALPALQMIDFKKNSPQVLVLTPTRELAIQVAEAFQSYARHLPKLTILPIYGGQKYDIQLRALKRGAQVIVGTPGRLMDHIGKGKLSLDHLKLLVLDEADEMLRMGFIDDVEWILEHTPEQRQIALFSATMPKEIAKVANKHLNNPEHIKIKTATTTAERIQQQYWLVENTHKLDALTRILELGETDGTIIFARTKASTTELAEKLQARGYRTAALNGDITQALREKTIDRLKQSKIDILVATDVAARGLDVDRISHVINYDVPYDTESYVHRIGRTGRAGREGTAILFVAKREMRMLNAIEKATGKRINRMTLPSTEDINQRRIRNFKDKISQTLATEDLTFFSNLIQELHNDSGADPLDIAAALAKLLQGPTPLLLKKQRKPQSEPTERTKRPKKRAPNTSRFQKPDFKKSGAKKTGAKKSAGYKKSGTKKSSDSERPYQRKRRPAATKTKAHR